MFKRWPHGDLKAILKNLYGGGVESLKEAIEIERSKIKLNEANQKGAANVQGKEQIRSDSYQRDEQQIRSSRLPYSDRASDDWPD